MFKPRDIIFNEKTQDKLICSLTINFKNGFQETLDKSEFIKNFPLDFTCNEEEKKIYYNKYQPVVYDENNYFCKNNRKLIDPIGAFNIYYTDEILNYYVEPRQLIPKGLYCIKCMNTEIHDVECSEPFYRNLYYTRDGIIHCNVVFKDKNKKVIEPVYSEDNPEYSLQPFNKEHVIKNNDIFGTRTVDSVRFVINYKYYGSKISLRVSQKSGKLMIYTVSCPLEYVDDFVKDIVEKINITLNTLGHPMLEIENVLIPSLQANIKLLNDYYFKNQEFANYVILNKITTLKKVGPTETINYGVTLEKKNKRLYIILKNNLFKFSCVVHSQLIQIIISSGNIITYDNAYYLYKKNLQDCYSAILELMNDFTTNQQNNGLIPLESANKIVNYTTKTYKTLYSKGSILNQGNNNIRANYLKNSVYLFNKPEQEKSFLPYLNTLRQYKFVDTKQNFNYKNNYDTGEIWLSDKDGNIFKSNINQISLGRGATTSLHRDTASNVIDSSRFKRLELLSSNMPEPLSFYGNCGFIRKPINMNGEQSNKDNLFYPICKVDGINDVYDNIENFLLNGQTNSELIKYLIPKDRSEYDIYVGTIIPYSIYIGAIVTIYYGGKWEDVIIKNLLKGDDGMVLMEFKFYDPELPLDENYDETDEIYLTQDDENMSVVTTSTSISENVKLNKMILKTPLYNLHPKYNEHRRFEGLLNSSTNKKEIIDALEHLCVELGINKLDIRSEFQEVPNINQTEPLVVDYVNKYIKELNYYMLNFNNINKINNQYSCGIIPKTSVLCLLIFIKNTMYIVNEYFNVMYKIFDDHINFNDTYNGPTVIKAYYDKILDEHNHKTLFYIEKVLEINGVSSDEIELSLNDYNEPNIIKQLVLIQEMINILQNYINCKIIPMNRKTDMDNELDMQTFISRMFNSSKMGYNLRYTKYDIIFFSPNDLNIRYLRTLRQVIIKMDKLDKKILKRGAMIRSQNKGAGVGNATYSQTEYDFYLTSGDFYILDDNFNEVNINSMIGSPNVINPFDEKFSVINNLSETHGVYYEKNYNRKYYKVILDCGRIKDEDPSVFNLVMVDGMPIPFETVKKIYPGYFKTLNIIETSIYNIKDSFFLTPLWKYKKTETLYEED